MPGLQVGVYPGYATDNDAEGTQVSSTYEGRHLTVRDDELIHPYKEDTFVNKGDPVVVCDAGTPGTYGNIVGVAFNDGTAASDMIAIDTEGIWNLQVYAEGDIADSAIEAGDLLYIRAGTLPGSVDSDGTGDAEISKMNDAAHQVFFGYALGSMVAGGAGIIAVKVHGSPFPEMEDRRYQTVATGAYGRHNTTILAGGTSEGMEYFDQRLTGTQTGSIYGNSSWMELATGGVAFVTSANLLVAHDVGIYDVGATLTLSRVVVSQMQAILVSKPASFYWWRMNLAAAGGTADALIAAANPASVGLVVAAAAAAATIGGLPLVEQGGVTYFVRLYATAS